MQYAGILPQTGLCGKYSLKTGSMKMLEPQINWLSRQFFLLEQLPASEFLGYQIV